MTFVLDEFQRQVLSWSFKGLLLGQDQVPRELSKSAADAEWLSKLTGKKAQLLPDRFLSSQEYQDAFYRPALLEFEASVIQTVTTSMVRNPLQSS